MTQLVARALAMITPDSHEAGGLLSRYGRVIGIEEGDYEGAQEISGRALAIAQREGDLHLELRTLTEAAYVDIFHVQFQKSLEKSEKAIELARRLKDTDAEMYGHIHATSSLTYTGDRERARLHAASGLELAEQLRDRFWLSTALSGNLDVSTLQGDWATARSFGVRGSAVAALDPRILSTQAMIEFEVGDFSKGSAFVDQLLEAMRLTVAGPNHEYATISAVIPAAARITGDLDKLEIAEQAAEAVLASPTASPYLATQARIGLAWLSVLRADAASAAEPNRRVRLLHRLGLHLHLVQVPKVAVVGNLGLLPQRLHHLQSFQEVTNPALRRSSHYLVLMSAVSHAQPNRKPPVAHPVHRAELLSQMYRVVVCSDHD